VDITRTGFFLLCRDPSSLNDGESNVDTHSLILPIVSRVSPGDATRIIFQRYIDNRSMSDYFNLPSVVQRGYPKVITHDIYWIHNSRI
jgi:hypothetical protein